MIQENLERNVGERNGDGKRKREQGRGDRISKSKKYGEKEMLVERQQKKREIVKERVKKRRDGE